MTKILIISNKSDVTSDFIVKKLKERHIDFYRFNTEELLNTCSLTIDYTTNEISIVDLPSKHRIDLTNFTSIYFRRPEIPLFNAYDINKAEKQFLRNEFAYTLEGIYKLLRNAFWISPLYAIREAENKIYQLELAKSIGFRIPNTIITNSYDDFLRFYKINNRDCIIKPIKSGLIESKKKSKVIFTSVIKEKSRSRREFEISPNLFQEHIYKKGDIRVIIVGNKVFATLIHSQENPQTKIDWRRGENLLKHSKIEIPSAILTLCHRLISKLNLRFGAIDLILDINDNYYFLEINPNGQWAWIEKQTGYKISDEIVNLLEHEDN